jgi:hypothetical protein
MSTLASPTTPDEQHHGGVRFGWDNESGVSPIPNGCDRHAGASLVSPGAHLPRHRIDPDFRRFGG